jgi:hypothetical protein
MTKQAMFTLHLIEDSDGQVRVVSDWSGEGQRCLALGVEIMQSLRDIQPFTNGELSFVLPTRTDIEH